MGPRESSSSQRTSRARVLHRLLDVSRFGRYSHELGSDVEELGSEHREAVTGDTLDDSEAN